MTVSVSDPLYSALRTAVLAGDTAEATRLLGLIDQANGIRRYYLSIRWQDVGGRPPAVAEIMNWPQNQTYLLELDRPIARYDVDQVLAQQARNPVSVMVTPDPAGRVGWTLIGDYSF